jgi:hypothetical protein
MKKNRFLKVNWKGMQLSLLIEVHRMWGVRWMHKLATAAAIATDTATATATVDFSLMGMSWVTTGTLNEKKLKVNSQWNILSEDV